ncbi:uncharacterized FAD-linked oxidoreductase ARB_02478 [Selaginella moellendorffii]|nr:uncharacterized FAD-linked oxidoreductase ARB_02478 [Selaginella moellendorffii]|eukprot:XP_002987070.2 uncharacterized FAD-linked oxidoreductase ARB_02478 [Selaginella moellendorffii]
MYKQKKMHRATYLVLLLSFVPGILSVKEPQNSSCRCLAFDHDCWPSSRVWNSFNTSVEGRLIRVLPPAAPCHDPFFDEQGCKEVQESWELEFWRTSHPGALYASNFESLGDQHRCSLASNRSSTCFQGAVPVYAVSVLDPLQVISAVKFASRYNLRLVVRTSGHDPTGRSTAPGSFAIWLHHLKSITFHESFVPEGYCPDKNSPPLGKIPAVTIGAGVQWEELYAATHERNSVITGGACSSVGAAGGFPQGGGHSLLSPMFGLAADNILQYEIVTAGGELLVANDWQNQELFWALRGGGGGTFGVVVSATYRTHPALESLAFALYNFTATTVNASNPMGKLVKKFVQISPELSDAGWSGNFFLSSRSLVLVYLLPNKNVSFANETLTPLTTYAEHQPGMVLETSLLAFSSFQEWHLAVQCGGQPSCITFTRRSQLRFPGASSLIPRKVFTDCPTKISRALMKITNTPFSITGVSNLGGDVARPRNNAVNPALRSALWHIILATNTNDNTTQAEYEKFARQITHANKLLPGSGAYMNEADFNEPNWQQSFFGENYPRLLDIKDKYDPTGLFVCHQCVGSEKWSNDLNCKLK